LPTETPIPTPTPLGDLTTFSQYGFRLVLIGQVDIQQAGLTATEATNLQGQATFPYGGANAVIIWLPAAGLTPSTILAGTYGILRTTQPTTDFSAQSEGEMTVGGQQGIFGAFTASTSGAVIGGGLIGAWTCPSPETAFALALTGADSTTVQVRFNELLSGFKCPSGSDG
jgi:hypothetical protein